MFNETRRFSPLLYNNLKGRIVDIRQCSRACIEFEVAVEASFTEFSVPLFGGLRYVGEADGKTVVAFTVEAADDQAEGLAEGKHIIPFQVAYAVSIHKAQGLEYDSVKIVITKDIEESITHDIFYTAITRARKNLAIYWTPETEDHVLSSLEVPSRKRDACILSRRCGLEMHPKS